MPWGYVCRDGQLAFLNPSTLPSAFWENKLNAMELLDTQREREERYFSPPSHPPPQKNGSMHLHVH